MEDTKHKMSVVAQAAETVRDYAEHAGEQFRDGCSQVAERTRAGYRRAGDVVRHNPGRSVASAFSVGLVVGVLICLTLAVSGRARWTT